MSSVQPISFCGQISVTSYKKIPETIEHFPTTAAQDNELLNLAKSIAGGIGSVRSLDRENANLFHALLEKFVNKKIPTIGGKRNIYVGQDSIIYADRSARQLGGTTVHVNF